MNALAGGFLVGISLIIMPLAVVSIPAAAVGEHQATESADTADPAWVACGISLECLR